MKGLGQWPAYDRHPPGEDTNKHCWVPPPSVYCSVGLLKDFWNESTASEEWTKGGCAPSDFCARLLFSFSSGNFKEGWGLRTVPRI